MGVVMPKETGLDCVNGFALAAKESPGGRRYSPVGLGLPDTESVAAPVLRVVHPNVAEFLIERETATSRLEAAGDVPLKNRFTIDGKKHAIVDTRVHIDNRIIWEIPPALPSYAEVAARQVRIALEEVEIDGAGQRWNPGRWP